MDVNEKPVKSCAIKVHLANPINRKSHVTLVVPELCSGLTIKTAATRKVGMNEQFVKSTELFISVRDNFKTNSEESDASNFFHILDVDFPGQYVNLRFCEFHLYRKELLPQILEKCINISEFRSRASIEEKLVSTMNTKLTSSQAHRNGSLKVDNFPRANVMASTNHNSQKTSQILNKNNLTEGLMNVEKRVVNRASFKSSKNIPDREESNKNVFGNYKNEVKCRPSLQSVKDQIKGLNMQVVIPKDEFVAGKEEILNSPCSSYSSSSIELKHNLSSSMPVLNKVRPKDFQNKKNLLMRTRVNSKTNISDLKCDSIMSEKLSTSRRQLPQVSISEEVVEEKRYLLSKQLEKRLIRRATINESSGNKRPVHKTQSLLGWKERFKACNEDSDDSRSLASQEVAEIMADAGPMGVIESDYEEPDSSNIDDEEELRSEDLQVHGKNVFLSLFDSMTSDPLENPSDGDLKLSECSSGGLNVSSPGYPESDKSNKYLPTRLDLTNKNLPPKPVFQSMESSFMVYSHVKQDRHSESHSNKLTLFDLLKPGVLKLFPVSVRLVEKRSDDVESKKVLPFKVYNDVVKLPSPSSGLKSNVLDEVTKTFDALKIGNLQDVAYSHQDRLKNKFRTAYQPGDLIIEVNNVNVLGFTESQFTDLENTILSKCSTIQMVIARCSGDS